jgi:hypothetical protein
METSFVSLLVLKPAGIGPLKINLIEEPLIFCNLQNRLSSLSDETLDIDRPLEYALSVHTCLFCPLCQAI